MTTTLYLIAELTWHIFKIFEGDQQIDECAAYKQHIERNFSVEATCVSRQDNIVIHNDIVYLSS